MGFGVGGGLAVEVVRTDFGVGLGFADKKRGKPYFVDFSSAAWRMRFVKGLPKNHIFSRALGSKGLFLDATAGFGQDAVMAMCLGFEVVAVERSAEVAEVLRDGIRRAIGDESITAPFERLTVVHADAREYMAAMTVKPDVVYIDPMFDKPKKSAKSPKNMQLLQELLGPAPEMDSLLEVALRTARDRVVVKQPLKARALRSAPNHSFKGQSIRYDVYLVASK